MNPVLFLDTSGWLAAMIRREPSYGAANRMYRDSVDAGTLLVTTSLILAEMHVLLMRSQGTRAALRFLDVVASEPSHEVVEVDAELRGAAVDRWLRKFQGQPFSVTDAISFEVMRRRRIGRALALDRHFVVAGFEILPE